MEQGSGGGNVVSGGSMGPVVQVAGSVGRLVVQQGSSSAEPSGRAGEDPWVRQARRSRVWDHVPANRKVDEDRSLVASVAARLAVLRDAAQERLAEDPWQEPEFATRFADWEAGVLRGRQASYRDGVAFDAHGVLVPWRDAPAGAQVVWCEHGGGLLVDGLVVEPAVRRGVLSRHPAARSRILVGVVVNLSGAYAPARLSADRTQILDDVSALLRQLLEPAARDLLSVDEQLPDFTWLCRMAVTNTLLAHYVAVCCVATARHLPIGEESLPAHRTGVLPSDLNNVRTDLSHHVSTHLPDLEPPDHIFLWRLLAHRPNRTLSELTELCPELDQLGEPLPALPSDQRLIDTVPPGGGERSVAAVPALVRFAGEFDMTPRAVALRAARLGRHALPPDVFPGTPVPLSRVDTVTEEIRNALAEHTSGALAVPAAPNGIKPSPENTLLLSANCDGEPPWLPPTEPVPPGHVVQASLKLGTAPHEICRTLAGLGFTPPAHVPDEIDTRDVQLLIDYEQGDWLRPETPIDLPHFIDSQARTTMSLSEILDRLGEFGLTTALRLPDEWTDLDTALLRPHGCLSWSGVRTGEAMPFAHVVVAARQLHLDPQDIAARLAAYGIGASCPALPTGLSLVSALDLIDDQEGSYLTAESYVGLLDLVRRARNLRVSVRQAHAWLTDPGIDIPAPAETVRAAIPLIPLADACGRAGRPTCPSHHPRQTPPPPTR